MYSHQNKTSITRLDQFINHKVVVGFLNPNSNHILQEFKWKYDDEYENLVLYDEKEREAKTYIPLVDITEVTNLTDDIYFDVIDVKTKDNIFSVCTMEERPISPICSKCGKDLSNEYTHTIDLEIGFGSKYDGNAIHRKYCEDCIALIFNFNEEIIS